MIFFSQEGAADFEEEDGDMEKGDLQKYYIYMDAANFPKASQKLPFMYGIAASFANPPKLTESPFSHKKVGNKKKAFTFTVETLTMESVRRGSRRKTRNSRASLIQFFRDKPLNDTDTAFVNKILSEHKNIIELKIKEYEKENPTEVAGSKRAHMRITDK